MMTTTTVSDTATSTTFPGGYDPGDTGNWSDIGPWWAAVVFAVVLAPFAFKTFLAAVRHFLR